MVRGPHLREIWTQKRLITHQQRAAQAGFPERPRTGRAILASDRLYYASE